MPILARLNIADVANIDNYVYGYEYYLSNSRYATKIIFVENIYKLKLLITVVSSQIEGYFVDQGKETTKSENELMSIAQGMSYEVLKFFYNSTIIELI